MRGTWRLQHYRGSGQVSAVCAVFGFGLVWFGCSLFFVRSSVRSLFLFLFFFVLSLFCFCVVLIAV